MPIDWDRMDDDFEKDSRRASAFLRLKAGDKLKVVFLGDTYRHADHWTGSSYEQCTGDTCLWCKKRPPQIKYAINVVVFYDDGEKLMKVWVGAASHWGAFKDIDQKYDAEKTLLDFSRIGEKSSTKYNWLYDRPLEEAETIEIQKMEMFDLPKLIHRDKNDTDFNFGANEI